MQSTVAPVTAVSDQSTERSYIETLGELGFLQTIHPTRSLVQNACQLALQASSLNVIVAATVAFLIYHAPQNEIHQLLSQQSLLTAALAVVNLFVSAIAIRAVVLSNSFEDALCQVVASDVSMGQPFTALITLKPKAALFAKAIEVELTGSQIGHGVNSARFKAFENTWRTSTDAPDCAVIVRQNLFLQANETYKIEQQLLIPQASNLELKGRNLEDGSREFEWWVAVRVKRSFGLDYQCRFPLSVLPQI